MDAGDASHSLDSPVSDTALREDGHGSRNHHSQKGAELVSTIERSIDVEVPVKTAYNQWTQFETFPEFMEGIDRIDQITDTRTHWVTTIGGVKREFDAEIIDQLPDQRVAWRSLDEPRQAGIVTFQPLGASSTRVQVQMDYDPEGLVEQAGDKLGVVERRVQGDLNRFKDFIESRGRETGAWRGEVGTPPANRPPESPGRF
jgi:uncharacterized membrane protein